MIEFQNISVGSKVWYWVESTDKLEEAAVKVTHCVADDPVGQNSYVDVGSRYLFARGYGKTWFTSLEDANAEMTRVHSHPVKFGDTVEFISTNEQGVVYSVDYTCDEDWSIIPVFRVAFENEWRKGVKENELKLIGNAFSDLYQAVKEGIEGGKREVKNAFIHLISDTPKFKRKKSIPKKAIIEMLETICKD